MCDTETLSVYVKEEKPDRFVNSSFLEKEPRPHQFCLLPRVLGSLLFCSMFVFHLPSATEHEKGIEFKPKHQWTKLQGDVPGDVMPRYESSVVNDQWKCTIEYLCTARKQCM